MYTEHIRYICLCLSDEYIGAHASCIGHRLDDGYLAPELVRRTGCEKHSLPCILIRNNYGEEIRKAFDLL